MVDSLQAEAARSKDETERADIVRAVAYINQESAPSFTRLWSGISGISQFYEAARSTTDERDQACGLVLNKAGDLIEDGRFELFVKGRQQQRYCKSRLETGYGLGSTAILTAQKIIVWICPSGISCALPKF